MPTVAQAGFPALTFDELVEIFGTRDMPVGLREHIAADVKTALGNSTIVCHMTIAPGTNSVAVRAIFPSLVHRRHPRIGCVGRIVLGLFALLSSVHQFIGRRDGAMSAT